MDLIMLPQALFVFYGALILGCGSVLGFILGRNFQKEISEPDPPLLLERRISTLESELEDTQSELHRLKNESQFLSELHAPKRELKVPRPDGKRFVA